MKRTAALTFERERGGRGSGGGSQRGPGEGRPDSLWQLRAQSWRAQYSSATKRLCNSDKLGTDHLCTHGVGLHDLTHKAASDMSVTAGTGLGWPVHCTIAVKPPTRYAKVLVPLAFLVATHTTQKVCACIWHSQKGDHPALAGGKSPWQLLRSHGTEAGVTHIQVSSWIGCRWLGPSICACRPPKLGAPTLDATWGRSPLEQPCVAES